MHRLVRDKGETTSGVVPDGSGWVVRYCVADDKQHFAWGAWIEYYRRGMSLPVRAMLLAMVVLLGAAELVRADMREFNSRFYRIHTDLEPGLAQDLARRLDVMHEEYARRLMRFESAGGMRIVDAYLFERQQDYLQFAGAGMRSTGGVFIPSRNVLAAFNVGQGRDSLRRTLQHEAFHQFAANSFKTPLPMWLNEGMAQYFEEGFWTGEGFALAQVPPRRVRQLQADIRARRLVPFEQFMKLSPEQWGKTLASRSSTLGATQYNQAWAMVHFLVNATDAADQPKYRARLVQMLGLIHSGMDADQAFVKAFSANYKGFQQRFLEWAGRLDPNAEATYIERQEVLADMMVALRKHGRTYRTIEAFRDAARQNQLEIQYSKGQIKWSTGSNTDLYFSRMDGGLMTEEELFLQDRHGAPLPDIVCHYLPSTILRTRFYKSAGEIEHEMLFEPAEGSATSAASPLTGMKEPALRAKQLSGAVHE